MAAKRRRLTASVYSKRHQGLLSLSELGLPACKLLDVIDKLRCHADLLDVPVSRKNVYRAQVEAFNAVKTVISVPRNDGSFYDWEICDLRKLLVHLTSECDGLAALLNELFDTRRCSKNRPWGLILYFDETVPGDSLRLDVPKKFMAVYCSIKELGPTVLKHEKVWMPLATVRTNVLQHIRGGWAIMLRLLLRHLFLGDMSISYGVHAPALRHRIVFLGLSNVLADAAALKQAWGAKGASGTIPCLECINVSNVRACSLLDGVAGSSLVDISCVDRSKSHQITNEELWRRFDELGEVKATMGADAFEDKSAGFGLNYSVDALMADKELRSVCPVLEVQTHDPAHVLFSNGTCHTDVSLVLVKLEKIKPPLTMEMLSTYFKAGWSMPRAWRHSSSFADVFRPSRVRRFQKTKKIGVLVRR